MADSIVIGAIKAILSLEDTGFTTGLAAAETSVAKFKSTSDQMVAGISAAGTEMEAASTGVSTLAATFGKMAAAVGGLFVLDKVVGSVIDFGREAVETASHIVDLSNKTGLSVESIQRMSFVAEQAGGSLEGFTTAAFKLGVNIEGGSKSVTAAVDALGLSLSALQAMKPDEQFETIVAALGKIDDASLRNKLGVELFGKSFAQIAAAVAEGYDHIADQAVVSTDAQLKAIDQLADEWHQFYDNQVTKATSILGQFAHGWTDAAKAQEMAGQMTAEQRDIYLTLLTQMEQGVKTMDLSTAAAIAMGKGFDVELSPPTKRLTENTKEQEAAAKKAAEEQEKYNQALTDLVDKQIIQAVTDGLKDGTEWLKLNTSAAEKAAMQFAQLHPLLESIVQDFSRIDLSGLTADAIALHGPLDDINAELERMHEATTSKIDLSGVFGEIHTESEQAVIDFDRMTEAERDAVAAAKAHEEALNRLGNSFYELGQTIGGVGGAIIGNVGDMLHVLDGIGAIKIPDSISGGLSAVAEGALNVWHATDSASTGINTMNGAIAGAMAGLSPQLVAATGGWSVAIGAAAGAITGLAKSAGNAKEELLASQDVLREWKDKVVEMFDATATGVQKLEAGTDATSKFVISIRDAYAELGHTAAETHDVLTRLAEAMNDGPDAVKRVLDEINGELERHEKIMQDWAAGVQTYTAGFVERVDGFRQALEGVTAATVETQAEFNRMGSFAITAFASILEQTGSAYAALEAIQAPMNQLIALQEQLGFTGSATFARLADISAVVQANQDIFQSIEGLQQMMQGLDQATLMTKDDVVLFGQDATSLFEQLRARGVDANTAMSLMQPTLQMLWEQQQKFHVEVDDATQALLDQAVAMGIVGAEHKSINQQILDALLAVEAAINRLPEAFANANAAAANLLSTLKAIGTAEGQMQVGLGASTGSGGVATSVTDVQNDLMTRWEQMYGTRDIPATVKHAQNEAFIAQGVEPPWPGFAKGGMVSDWLQSMYGPGAVPIVAHVGEGILNPFATAAIGGKSGLDAMNTNPWAAVQRMASMQMPSPTGMASAPMSSGGMTIGDINITVHAPGGDPQAVARATKSAFDEWYDEVESGRGASRYRRLHQQVVVS